MGGVSFGSSGHAAASIKQNGTGQQPSNVTPEAAAQCVRMKVRVWKGSFDVDTCINLDKAKVTFKKLNSDKYVLEA